ncbi:MAG: hypothetical protein GMKNLPBB_01703 [Myxococcota bacterium]|nr:hypothetical protein [Myxococcota bacterium]
MHDSYGYGMTMSNQGSNNDDQHQQQRVDSLLKQAEYLYNKGMVNDAVQYWNEVLEIDPEHPKAQLFLTIAGANFGADALQLQRASALRPKTTSKSRAAPDSSISKTQAAIGLALDCVGIQGAAIIDLKSGAVLVQAPNSHGLKPEMMKMQIEALRVGNIEAEFERVVILHPRGNHLIQPVVPGKALGIYLMFDPEKTNMKLLYRYLDQIVNTILSM